jgi:hypothetical protein
MPKEKKDENWQDVAVLVSVFSPRNDKLKKNYHL